MLCLLQYLSYFFSDLVAMQAAGNDSAFAIYKDGVGDAIDDVDLGYLARGAHEVGHLWPGDTVFLNGLNPVFFAFVQRDTYNFETFVFIVVVEGYQRGV